MSDGDGGRSCIREKTNATSHSRAFQNKAITASCQGASDLQTCQDLLTGGNTMWVPANSFSVIPASQGWILTTNCSHQTMYQNLPFLHRKETTDGPLGAGTVSVMLMVKGSPLNSSHPSGSELGTLATETEQDGRLHQMHCCTLPPHPKPFCSHQQVYF